MTAETDFETHFETLALDEKTLQMPAGETIVPETMQQAGLEPIAALRSLPRMHLDDGADTIPDLKVVGTLGEGGMGLVQLATQVALQRDVAVKTLRTPGDDAAPKLLQEAYITGRLEHPNIIPVYTLGQDSAGAPMIVMKRIEGVSWLEVMRDPAAAPGDVEPDLEWHLEILLHVCNAVRFAHSRGIVHRDIKPENVMIGPFGEVYLLDWGIAVGIDEDATKTGIPHRSTAAGMAGTPAYMAPEMTDDSAEAVDERTDVYLLGSTLYEVLAGEPRHTGTTLFEVMRSAFESEPIDERSDLPGDLVAVVNRATAKDPDERFQSVEEFQNAIADHLAHRTSNELLTVARQLLDDLRPLVLTREFDRSDDDEIEIRNLLTECRFACRQALKSWPENEQAQATQREYLELKFHNAVRRQDTLSAQAALRELSETGPVPETLREELATLSSFLDAERAEFEGLRAFAAELDMSKGRVSRSLAVLMMGTLWSATLAFTWWRATFQGFDLATNHVESVWRVVGIGILGLIVFRKQLFATVGNRRIAFLLMMVIGAIAGARFIAHQFPGDVDSFRSFETLLYALAAMSTGVASDDRRIMLLGAIYFPIALTAPWIGHHQLLLIVLGHLIVFGGLAWFWTPHQIRKRWRI